MEKYYLVLKNRTNFSGRDIDRKGLLFNVSFNTKDDQIFEMKIEKLLMSDYSYDSGSLTITESCLKRDGLELPRIMHPLNDTMTEEDLLDKPQSCILGRMTFFKAPDDDAAKLLYEINNY